MKWWELRVGWWDLSTEWRCIRGQRISLFHFFVFSLCGWKNQTDSRWERWNDAERMQLWPLAKIDRIYINSTFKVWMIELISRGNLLKEAWTKRDRERCYYLKCFIINTRALMDAELLSLMNLATYRLFSLHKSLKIANLIIISLWVDFRVPASLLGKLTVWQHRWTNDGVRTAGFNLIKFPQGLWW